eukprot:243630-Chlamydomonas_euryale.AAC.7
MDCCFPDQFAPQQPCKAPSVSRSESSSEPLPDLPTREALPDSVALQELGARRAALKQSKRTSWALTPLRERLAASIASQRGLAQHMLSECPPLVGRRAHTVASPNRRNPAWALGSSCMPSWTGAGRLGLHRRGGGAWLVAAPCQLLCLQRQPHIAV